MNREQILFRDGYVCRECGLNCRDLERAYWTAVAEAHATYQRLLDVLPMEVQRVQAFAAMGDTLRTMRLRLRRLGFSESRAFAEVHHLRALEEGGDNSDGNRACVCTPCHKRLTRELNARLRRRLTKRVAVIGVDRAGRVAIR